MLELNKEILIYLNSLLDFRVIEKIALIFADAPIFLVPLFLIIAWIYQNIKHKGKNEEKKKDLIFIFYACLIAFIINLSIQHFVHFDRPESVIEGVGKLLLKHLPDASFPSDHTSISIAFLTSLFLAKYKKTGAILAIPIILMCISRVILGVHWPLDVLVGAIIGISSALISFKILKGKKIVDKFNDFLLKIASWFSL